MKKTYNLTTKAIALFLALLLIFYLLPISAVAEGIGLAEQATQNAQSSAAQTASQASELLNYFNEAYEVSSLREESVKHFRLEDGSYVAAQYGSPVHYLDENGAWQDINNSLTVSGSELVTSDARVKFTKKTPGNGSIFTLHNGNTKITLSLVGASKKVEGIVTNTEETETTEIGKLMNLEGLSSRIRYNEILDGVDIEYVLDGLGIKENIIIKEKSDSYSYTFELALNGLEATLRSSGDISITQSGEQKYIIPAPVVFDSADTTAPSASSAYTLKDNGNGKYTLTVSVSSEWMNSPDRAYPVTLDPAIVTGTSNVMEIYGSTGNLSGNEFTVSSSEKIIISANLPSLPRGATVSKVDLSLRKTSSSGSYVGAYLFTGDSDVSAVQLGELIDYCYTVGSGTGGQNRFVWDVKKACEMNHLGYSYLNVLLTSVSDSGSTTFASSQNSTTANRPTIAVSYVSTLGVEDYFSYSTQGGGAMGTGYVNYATGGLTFAIGTLTTTDSLMPVTPSLVYNSALANKSYTSGNATTPYTSAITAYGFKLNLVETLVRRTYTSGNGSVICYVWTDGDGTEHYFYQAEGDSTKYVDDSGLLLTLTVPTSGNPTITDINENERTFVSYSDSSAYVLRDISDKIGNKVSFTYDSSKQITEIRLCPYGSSGFVTLRLSYTSGVLCKVSNPHSKESVILRYSDTYNGAITESAKKYLRQIDYAHEENGAVIIDATMYYEYNASGYLVSAKNGLADYTVNYEWTNGKVSSVYEKGGTTEGVRIGFTYGDGYTEVTTPGGDASYSTAADNIITRYIYDDYFRVISSYSTNLERSQIYGATSGKYETQENIKNNLQESTVIGGSPTNYVLNGDFSQVSGNAPLYWERSHSTIVVQDDGSGPCLKITPTASDDYTVSQRLYLSAGTYTFAFDVRTICTQNVTVKASVLNYNGATLSTSDVNVNEIWEGFDYYTHAFTFEIPTDRDIELEISVSSSGATSSDTSVRIKNVMLERDGGASVQYSYLNYGSFEDGYRVETSTDPSDVDQETFWTATAGVSFVEDTTSAFGTVAKIKGNLTSKRSLKQTAYTYLVEDTSSNVGLRFIVSGFAKAPEGAYSGQVAKFAIRVDVHYLQWDTGADYVVSHYFNFSPDNTEWQFISGIVDTAYTPIPGSAEEQYSFTTVSSIDVCCEFSHQNGGYAYFDNLCFYKEGINTTRYYYNAAGLPVATESFYSSEYREYNDDNTVHLIANNEGELCMYEYNANGLVSNETYYEFVSMQNSKIYPYYHVNSEGERDPFDAITVLTPKLRTVYTYNEYGLITKVETYPAVMSGNNVVKKQGSPSVVTVNDYKTDLNSPIFGALTSTSDGAGTTVRYFYDESRGYLLAEINVSAKSGTVYSYDAIGNLVSAKPATYNSSTDSYSTVNSAESVTYTYNSKNELSKITTATSTYSFTYDSFGNLARFAEGNIRYYYDKAGKLTSVYAYDPQGYSYECYYEYDDLGRLIYEEAWYEVYEGFVDSDGNVYDEWGINNVILKEYEYTADGRLYLVYDGLCDEYTRYSYDASGRLIGSFVYDGEYENELAIEYIYENGTASRIASKLYGISTISDAADIANRLRIDYSYDSEERLEEENFSHGSTSATLNYVYDDFGRLSGKTLAGGGFSSQSTYGYKTSGGVTTGEVVSYTSRVGSVTTTYTYTYDSRGNIESISKNGSLLYVYYYDDLGQLIWEENLDTGECYSYYYDNAGNIIYREEGMFGGEDYYEYAPSPYGDRLVSYNGESISYDSSGRTVFYRGKDIVYCYENLSLIRSIGDVSFTYNADGMRRTKTVDGVTHTYYYDGINLISEEWNGNVLVFLYDASGSPIGMQYRNDNYASGIWDTYYYEKNLQGDIVAVYSKSGTKLVSYTYDAWGMITATTYSNGGSSTSVVNNPLRYRGYYYDDDLDLYYLATRYYDPETCRFITADDFSVLTATPMGLTDKNLYAYCDNNPIMRVDNGGAVWDTVFDVISLGTSIVEVCINPYDVWTWIGLVGDVADLIPFVTGVGETTRAIKIAANVADGADDVVDIAKGISKAADAASDFKKATGSYEIIYKSGMNYVGKGGFDRAITSAIEHAKPNKLNNRLGDTVVSITWKKADNAREAFIDEYLWQTRRGVLSADPNLHTYNKIWSPGRRYLLP